MKTRWEIRSVRLDILYLSNIQEACFDAGEAGATVNLRLDRVKRLIGRQIPDRIPPE
jgi:hypothetical protein